MSEILIRLGNPGDVTCIAQFNVEMARETENKVLDSSVITEGVRRALDGSVGAMYFVAVSKGGEEGKEGEVVGQLMITTEFSDWRNNVIWWIQSVFVKPQWRKQGIFKSLYKYAKEQAILKGAGGLRLYADDTNQNAHLTYEALGMVSHYKVFEDMWT